MIRYYGERAGAFSRTSLRDYLNGMRVSAGSVASIPRNQSWLGFEDPSAVCFFNGMDTTGVDGSGAVRIDGTGTFMPDGVLVQLTPGVTQIEVSLLVARQMAEDPATAPLTPPQIQLTSGAGVAIISTIPATTELKSIPRIPDAMWLSTTLTMRAAPVATFDRARFTIGVVAPSPGIYIFSGYYRGLVAADPIPFDDGT
jgi:hypothetical protein